MDKANEPGRQAGFTLVELMVAMVITLIVSGSIYGMIASGQTAFKRDPELSDRQQSIRVAMDVIQRDIVNAGNRLGLFYQVFAEPADAAGIMGANGVLTDHLVIYTGSGGCPDVTLAVPAQSGANLNAVADIPACYPDDAMAVVVYGNLGAKWGFLHRVHAQASKANFPPGLNAAANSQIQSVADLGQLCTPQQVLAGCTQAAPTAMAAVTIMAYVIAPEPDGTPGLWRSTTGGYDVLAGGGYAPPPPAVSSPGVWQLIARGIEDMQIQYFRNGVWNDTPTVTMGTPASVVTQVRVTLQARTATIRATAAVAGPNALRGQLTSVGVPRPALNYLSGTTPAPLWE